MTVSPWVVLLTQLPRFDPVTADRCHTPARTVGQPAGIYQSISRCWPLLQPVLSPWAARQDRMPDRDVLSVLNACQER
jgi:hypothetical protein